MSSRQLRKLQKQRELEQAKTQVEHQEAEEEEEDDDIPAPVGKPSVFASFAALQNSDIDNEADDSEEERDSQPLTDTAAVTPEPPKKAKKSKKKKKKTKLEDNSHPEIKPVDGLDEVDKALKDLNIVVKEAQAEPVSAGPEDAIYEGFDIRHARTLFLLRVDSERLKVGNEMKNFFGRASAPNQSSPAGPVLVRTRRRQQIQHLDLETVLKGRHRPGRGLPEITLRRNLFIQGKEDWPRATTGGLSMESLVTAQENNISTFTFVHDSDYKSIQEQFNMMVEIGNPENLIVLLQKNPYHISLLLQVSKIAKDQGDHSLSSDLVERALFSFGRTCPTTFAQSISKGLARLQFSRRENREFWLAGYHYIRSLIMKGTYETALEWAITLLSIDPKEDPYCMLLMVHHLAIRAREFEWLLDLSQSSIWPTINEKTKTYNNNAYASHITPSLALAALYLEREEEAKSLLRTALENLPWLFCRLYQEFSLDTPPPSIWAAEPRSDAEKLLSEIYIEQTKAFWKKPEAVRLLKGVAEGAQKVAAKEIPLTENSVISLDVARFVYLDNTPALMRLVPSSLLHRRNNSDPDPLPPDDNLEAPESLSSFYDPIEALRRLIPGFIGNGGAEDERAIAAAGIRRIADGDSDTDREEGEGEEDEEGEDEGEQEQPRESAAEEPETAQQEDNGRKKYVETPALANQVKPGVWPG